jgi:ammonium transporter, Amt family
MKKLLKIWMFVAALLATSLIAPQLHAQTTDPAAKAPAVAATEKQPDAAKPEQAPVAPAAEAKPAAEVKPAAVSPAAAPAAAPATTEATPAPAPVPNKGDTAWISVATMLVVLMTVPGLALFYGGLVRSKNMLSILMQVLVVFSLILVLWAVYGYSLAFGGGGKFIGNLDKIFLKGITLESVAATFSKGVYLYELSFVAFQATFAAITCCLIVGAFAERVKFSAVLLFCVLWFTFSYIPIAHMVWFWDGPDAFTSADVVEKVTANAGLLWQWGALDFAGGTVVHINAAWVTDVKRWLRIR